MKQKSDESSASVAEAAQFLAALCRRPEPEVTFQTFDDSPDKAGDLARILHGTLADVLTQLRLLQKRGAGVFVSVNEVRQEPGKAPRRGKRFVGVVRAYWADLDGSPELPALPLPPSIVVRTKRGHHVYWLAVEGVSPEDCERVNRAIVHALGGDPNAVDCARVLRLPGFFHQKNRDDPFMVTLVEAHPDRIYTLAETEAAFPAPPERERPSVPRLDLEEIEDRFPLEERVERARRYLAKMDPAISGEGGHNQTFEAALAVTRGFALPETEAMDLLEEYNERCEPSWTTADLEHKLASAAADGRRPPGYLLRRRDGQVEGCEAFFAELRERAARLRAQRAPEEPGVAAAPSPAPDLDAELADLINDIAARVVTGEMSLSKARQITSEAAGEEDDEAALHRLDAAILDAEVTPLDGLLDQTFARLRRRASREEVPIITPWRALNRALGRGLWPGLHVLVGNTGTGKTQLALQLALHAARRRVPVVYLAFETRPDELLARAASLVDKRLFWSDLWRGAVEEHALARIEADCRAELAGLPLLIKNASPYGWRRDSLLPLLERVRDRHRRAPLLVLDYLQIVGGDEREDQRTRIQRAAYCAAEAAQKMDATAILLSSTARANYDALGGRKKKVKPPESDPTDLVGAGKESGEIEFGADVVLVLVREKDAEPEAGQEAGDANWLAIAKLRAGRPGWVKLRFDGSRFSEPAGRTDDAAAETATTGDTSTPTAKGPYDDLPG